MKTKLYYTCPIIAAYMSKYFEVKYHKGATSFSVDMRHNGKDTPQWFKVDDYEYKKIYIHPDSLHIFKAQDSDQGSDEDGCQYEFDDNYDGKGWWRDIECREPHRDVFIDKRNGMSFFMPEVEK